MNTEDKTVEMDNTQLIHNNKKSNVNKRALFTAAAAILGGGAATAAAVEGKKWYDNWTQEHQEKEKETNIEEEKFVHEPKKEEPKPQSKETTPEPEPPVPPKNPYDIDAIGGVEQVEIDGELVNAMPVLVNGHEGYLIDRDNDGKADFIIYDKNDNQVYDKGELVDLEEEGIEIEMPAFKTDSHYTVDAIIDQEYQIIEGQNVLVTKAIVNDHHAVLFDLDHDGHVDYMLIDANDDGNISENEQIDTLANNIDIVVPVPEEETAIIKEIRENGINITEVYDVKVYETFDGTITFAKVRVNGHDGFVYDKDSDGYIDAIAIDVNDDNNISDDEIIELNDYLVGHEISMKEIAEAGGFDYDTIIGDYPPIDDGSDIAMVDGEEIEELSEAPEDNYEMLAVVEEDEATNDTAGFDPNYTGEEVDEDLVADIDETIEEDIVSDDNIG